MCPWVLPFAIATLDLSAQSPLRFEVASVRQHQSNGDEPSNRRVLPGGRFVATATTVRTLVRIALGIDDNRMSGAPSWIDSETFDINATTVGHAEITTPQQFQQIILSLLEDRFQFKYHREQKEGPVYWLEVYKPGKLGPALKESSPAAEPNMSTNSNGSMADMKSFQDVHGRYRCSPPPSISAVPWKTIPVLLVTSTSRSNGHAKKLPPLRNSFALHCSEGTARTQTPARERYPRNSRHRPDHPSFRQLARSFSFSRLMARIP